MWIFLAGAAGAVCRYLVDGLVQGRWGGAMPIGTLTVNLSGALTLGFVVGFGIASAPGSAIVKVAGTGFIGAYTTFSTLTYETVRLLREGARWYAAATLAGSSLAGFALAGLGLVVASHL